MASPFQRYTGGIEASTGNLVQASGQMAAMTANTIAGFGQNLAQGIQQYNENSQKSEAANAKIQMLGQAYADKIAMYSKDPEIAQSGILDSLMAKAKMLQDAPTKGLSQRVMIAHEAETSLAGFGNQLQEWSFIRGREMERAAEEGLNKFAGVTSVTSPAFAASNEFQFDPNKSMPENKAEALRKLNVIRAKNPNMQGTDNEFIQNWLQNTEQTMAKVDPSVVPAAVTNDILSQIQAERNIIKGNAEAAKTGLVEDFLARGKMSPRADYEKVTTAAVEALRPKTAETAQGTAPAAITTPTKVRNYITPEEVSKTKEKIKSLEGEIKTLFGVFSDRTLTPNRQKQKDEIQAQIKTLKDKLALASSPENTPPPESVEFALASRKAKELNKEEDRKLNNLTTDAKLVEFGSTMLKEVSPVLRESIVSGKEITIEDLLRSVRRQENKRNPTIKTEFIQSYGTGFAEMPMPRATEIVQKYSPAVDIITNAAKDLKIDLNTPMTAEQLKAIDNAIQSSIPSTQKKAEELKAQLASLPAKSTPESVRFKQQQAELPKIAPIALGEQVVGSQEIQQRRTVAERQREVADFVTSKMGAIDPTDPERKRRLPVSGFDKFYRSLVPEAEIREYTTPSGVRMMYANGKWEQIKAAEPMSIKDIREANLGLFGTQTEKGLMPSEYIDGSGVFIGGVYKGSNAQLEKYEDEITKLIDARRSVKELQKINDQMGESLSPSAAGRAAVEKMNLAAMLRTDIVGVGTVSNYEQGLIDKVIKDPTDFFSLESKDRAILIALAQRVDRRMKAISSSKGLTIQIKDGTDGNKYQALREQYLREKGILK